jgi:uncharacterized protein (UPF0335 family)
MSDTSVAREQLLSIVERIERLEEEKKAIGDDIKDVYAESKANGFDTKILRQIVKLRKLDAAEREEAEAMLDLYMSALGMTPNFETGDLMKKESNPNVAKTTVAVTTEVTPVVALPIGMNL